jgi:hypothetical protein
MIDSFKVTWKTHIKIIILSYLFTLVFNNVVNSILDRFIMKDFILSPTKYIILNFYLYIILLLIPITVLHELLHGLIFKLFGGKIEFGFKLICAYTKEISGISIKRVKFIIILLTPLIIISILSIFLPVYIGGIVFLINFLGSSGDIYMVIYLLRFNNKCEIIDRDYGFDVVAME